nr:hypothetical protein [Tanacetum cinerariifolium]
MNFQIVYNDGLTSKSDHEIKPLVSSERIDGFNLNDESSSDYGKENVSHLNDLFNIIHLDDLKSKKDNDGNDIDIIQSSKDMETLPAADQRHPWLRYQIEKYNKGIRYSYEQRLETIWSKPVNRVHVLDFEGLTPEMRQDLVVRLRVVYSREGWQVFEMAEAGFGAYWDGSDRLIPNKGDLRYYWIEILSSRDFLGPAPSYVLIQDPVRILCHRMIACSIIGRDRHLRRHTEGRKSGSRLSGGHFIERLAMHLGLVSDEGLRGLQVVTRELPLIDLHELRRLNICTSAHEGDEADLAAKEVAKEIPTPAQAPLPPAPQPRTMSQRIKRMEEEMRDLLHDILMDASGQTYQPFDNTLISSFWLSFQRRVRPRTGDASTSASPATDAQPDP